MSEELKPCPFCGGEAKIDTVMDAYFVHCEKCRVLIDNACRSKESALSKWNKRTTDWIPVEERLPEESGFYFVTADFGEQVSTANCHFDKKIEKWWATMYEVIAWMPLPEPYKNGL